MSGDQKKENTYLKELFELHFSQLRAEISSIKNIIKDDVYELKKKDAEIERLAMSNAQKIWWASGVFTVIVIVAGVVMFSFNQMNENNIRHIVRDEITYIIKKQ